MCYNELWSKSCALVYDKILVAVAACLICGYWDILFYHWCYCLPSTLHIHSMVVVFGPLPSALPNEAALCGQWNVPWGISDMCMWCVFVPVFVQYSAMVRCLNSCLLQPNPLPLSLSFPYFVLNIYVYTSSSHFLAFNTSWNAALCFPQPFAFCAQCFVLSNKRFSQKQVPPCLA